MQRTTIGFDADILRRRKRRAAAGGRARPGGVNSPLRRHGREGDPWVGDDPKELVDTGPRNGPRLGALAETAKHLHGALVVIRGHHRCVDEDIGVDGPHAGPLSGRP